MGLERSIVSHPTPPPPPPGWARAIWRVETGYRRLTALAATVGVLFLGAAAIFTVADIVLRTAIGFALIGTIDIIQLCIMAAAATAIPHAFMTGAHVSVDLATDWLPDRALAAVKALAALAGLAMLILITRYGFDRAQMVIGYGDTSQTIGIPIVWYWGPLLTGMGLAALACVVLAASFTAVAVTGRIDGPGTPPPTAAAESA